MSADLRFASASTGKKILVAAVQVFFVLYCLLIFYPLFNMIMSSFKTTREILRFPFALPKSLDFANYKTVLVDRGFGRFFFNSLWMTGTTMAFVLLFGSMAAYGVSRYTYRLRTTVYLVFLSGIMLPLKAAVIPLFIIMKRLDFVNKPISVILIFIAMSLPSTIFILSGFMKAIPKDLEYAARIDGCSDWMIYRHVVMPVVTPAIALVTIYNSVPVWNDFFFPLVFLQDQKFKTLPLGLTNFFGQYSTDWSLLFTALSLAILPMLLLYAFMAKYFIKGMTAGAVK
ncbi:MAG: multiple sugar transport system permease protein [Spirochaetes bacterium]|nr:MAG: multiple sugar transport system permease protein [Spirochaetota bacterium]